MCYCFDYWCNRFVDCNDCSIDIHLKCSSAGEKFNPAYYNGSHPLSLPGRSRWLTESKALEKSRLIRSNALPSSSHFVINSSAERRLVRVEHWGRKPCCREVNNENWDRWASIFSLRIASSTLQTTGVRLMDLNRFGSAARGAFATGAMIAWRQSSGTLEVWRERLKMRESVGAMYGLRVLRALGNSPSGPTALFGLRASRAR